MYNNIVPLTAILIGWTALGGLPSPLEAVAATAIIPGAILLQRRDPDPEIVEGHTVELSGDRREKKRPRRRVP